MSSSKRWVAKALCWGEKYSLPVFCNVSLVLSGLVMGSVHGPCWEMGHSGVREEGFVKVDSVFRAEGKKPNSFLT